MTSTRLIRVPAKPALPEQRRQAWLDWVEERSGLHIRATRLHTLESSLRDRMAATGAKSHEHYFHRVAVRGDREESAALLERLLNHETRFFRHLPSFEALATGMIPKLAARARTAGSAPLAFWSAGCSTGEEAYSIAATALGVLGAGPVDFTVTGSDWSEDALSKARAARWNDRAKADIPEPYLERYFRGHRHEGAAIEPHPAVKARVRFTRFNFLDPATYPAGPFHAIFCQNVLIYFREQVRSEVMANLASCLAPGGYLVPAPGEVPPYPIAGARPVWFGQTLAFERVPGQRPAAKTDPASGEVLHGK